MVSRVGHVMAQAISSRPLIVDAQVQSRNSPCETCDGQSVNGTGFSPRVSVLPCQYHCTDSQSLSILSPTLYNVTI